MKGLSDNIAAVEKAHKRALSDAQNTRCPRTAYSYKESAEILAKDLAGLKKNLEACLKLKSELISVIEGLGKCGRSRHLSLVLTNLENALHRVCMEIGDEVK